MEDLTREGARVRLVFSNAQAAAAFARAAAIRDCVVDKGIRGNLARGYSLRIRAPTAAQAVMLCGKLWELWDEALQARMRRF